MTRFSCFLVLLLLGINSFGQRTFDIRLVPQNIDCETNEFCYDVQIRSGNDMLWRYAGQNYRLFYNGALAEFSRVVRVLDAPYADPEVVQDIQHLDLSAQGNLSFDSDLSWLNYFIDMNVADQGKITSPDVWTTTSTICFTSLVDILGDPDICFEMVWAREELTFNYATAFVEISEWVSTNSTNDLVTGSTYFDLNTESGYNACFDQVCGDNPPSYDAKIVLKSNDPEEGIACYSLQLKSATSRIWNLGDMELALLFDGQNAEFVSARSSIEGFGEVVLGETLENNTFPDGSGNISFEDNVSAVSFSIDQGTGNMVMDQTYQEVAEVCLEITEENPEDCFEIVFARDGLTLEYFSESTDILQAEEASTTAISFTDYNKCNETECADLAAPMSNGDVTICSGDDIPLLSVQESSGYEIRWYSNPIGGSALAQGATYGPAAAGVFYAETFDPVQNCRSTSRTAVALISMPLPSLEVRSKVCEEDQSSYSIVIITDANSVEADKGAVEKLVGFEWRISGLQSGENVQLTLNNSQTNCQRVENIDAPNCDCQLVAAPISDGNQMACLGSDYPSLSVAVTQSNVTVDWYARVDGGSPIATNTTVYNPVSINETGEFTFYAQARSIDNGCESSTRTAVTLSVMVPPVYAFVSASCDKDLSTYGVVFYSDAGLVTSDEGVIINDENGVWRISQIPTGTNVNVTITAPSGCRLSQTIVSPSCECDMIEAPICEGMYEICEGMDYPGFKAYAYKGKGIRWYDSAVEGSLLSEGNNFKPTLSGSYYAEAIDSLTGCVSQQRTRVELVINSVPDLQLTNSVLCDGETIAWTDLINDASNTDGVLEIFNDFRDAMNRENALTESTITISEIEAYFARKTTPSGCYDIETIIVVPEQCGNTCLASAGEYRATSIPCFAGDSITLSVTEVTAPGIPTGFVQAYYVTQGEEKEVVDISPLPSYKVAATGIYRLHSFVFRPFDPALEDAIGDDGIGFDDFADLIESSSEICAAIDRDGVLFNVEVCEDMCQAKSGTLTAREIGCLEEGPIELSYNLDQIGTVVPEGFMQIFVLTSGPELIIMGAGTDPFFTDSPGEYRVHSFVFDPTTFDFTSIQPGISTGGDVHALLLQGGGDICGSLDLNGAYFNVQNCEEECEAEAGSTIPVADLCVGDDPILIRPGLQGAVIPEGFTQILVMTTGSDLIIQGTDASSFEISAPGDYRLHSLVYDPTTLDLSSVEIGVTSASVVVGLLEQGGGDICGSLDVQGALFSIEACEEECEAEAGSTIPVADLCVGEDPILIRPGLQGAVIPEGFTQILVMTTGSDLIIQGTDASSFEISAPGDYRLHSLVYDPTTLDLSSVEIGVTSASVVVGLLEQGGGDICGSLDVQGALFSIEACEEECEAEAGSTIPVADLCVGDDPIDITPGIEGVNVPEGFIRAIVVTTGQDLIIQSLSNTTFQIAESGDYRVHSLVYDPNTLDLSDVEFGVTPASALLTQLEQGSGDVCGDLDVEGALFQILDCEEECEALSGTTIAREIPCFDGSPLALEVDISDNSVVPDGFVRSTLVTRGSEFIVVAIQEDPYMVTEVGDYDVHSFVYDPTTFDVGSIQMGTADFFDVYLLITEGGGSICASLDFFGATFIVEECVEEPTDLELTKDISNLNPSVGEEITFTIQLSNTSETDATGISVIDYLPQGYTLTGNISNGGITNQVGEENQVIWTDLNVGGNSEILLSFMARVLDVDNSESYKNVAEVTAADQIDEDSSPNNDDGDQSEDDESSVMPNVSNALIDLELIKTANVSDAQLGDLVMYNINLSNRAMVVATGVEVTDVLPAGIDLGSVANISNGGQLIGNTIVWSGLEMGFLSATNLTFMAKIDDVSGGMIMNSAQVTAADQEDVDSAPNNDDGDQSEDDESKVTIQVSAPFIDLSLVKEVSNSTPEIGDDVTFEITVNNNGIVEATGVSIADMLPMQGFDLESISNMNPVGQVVGNTIIWTANSIPSNGEVVFTFDVTVTEGGTDYKNIAQVTSADQQDSDSAPNNDDGDQSEDDEDHAMVMPMMGQDIIDIEIDKNVSELNPNIGDEVTYTIVVRNNGPSEATNLNVMDVTPDGIDPANVSGGGVNDDGNIMWTISSLDANESVTFTYESIVFQSESDDYTNVVQLVRVDQQDIDSSPNNDDGDQSEDDEASATIFPQVEEIIDLQLTKSVDQVCAEPGTRVNFTIELFNNSDAVATGVSVQDRLPSGIIMPEDISNGGVFQGNNIVWSGLSLAPQQLITITFSAEIMEGADSYKNVVEIIAADQADIDSSPNNDDGDQSEDDESSVMLGGGAMFDLELEKIVDDPFAQPGERVRFDIIVRNTGCIDASNVAVRDIIPGGYKSIRNITDGGILNANIITWNNIDIPVGTFRSLTFTAEIVHFSINCDYMNVAEIIADDNWDIDSDPNNDDGDQSEDDEDMAEVYAGTLADLYLEMSADVTSVETGDFVNYTVSLCNNGPATAFNVQVKDYLPAGLKVVGDINYKGEVNGQEITWSGFTVVPGTCADLQFQVEVESAPTTRELKNEAEIVLSDQLDPNSSPGNKEPTENDYASISITQFVAVPALIAEVPNMSKVEINTALFLEGAYNKKTGELNTTLNRLGYLPGQKPGSFLSIKTPVGQPYSAAPWNYKGTEGMIFDWESDLKVDYPIDVVDWVLVSIRESKEAESTVLSRAGLLMKDGTVTFAQDTDPVYLDLNKSYYILIQHRNHLPVLTPHSIEIIDGSIGFDFRTNESYIGLLGSGQKDVNGTYCVFAANGDQFKSALSEFDINVRDMNAWFESNGLNSSYLNADYDMNGDVNVNDQIIWLINNGVFSDVPR